MPLHVGAVHQIGIVPKAARKKDSERIPVMGGTLFCKRLTNRGFPSLLGLHGYNDTSDTFRFLFPFLKKHFDVTLPDWRGFGDSSRIRDGYYTFGNLLGDLASVSGRLPAPYVLLGHSMGASAAARYAGIVPSELRALVLLEGFSGLVPEEQEIDRMAEWVTTLRGLSERASPKKKARPTRVMKDMEEVVQFLGRLHRRLSESSVREIAPGLVRKTKGGFVWHYDPEFRKRVTPIPFPPALSRALWRRVSCPVLFLYGEESDLLPGAGMDEILGHFQNVEVHKIDGAGHNFHHDHPQEVVRLMDSFFRKNGIIK